AAGDHVIEPAGYFDARLPGHARADPSDPGRYQCNEALRLWPTTCCRCTGIATEYNQCALEIVKLYCGGVDWSAMTSASVGSAANINKLKPDPSQRFLWFWSSEFQLKLSIPTAVGGSSG